MKSIDFSELKGLGEELKTLAKEIPQKRQELRDKLGVMEKEVNDKLKESKADEKPTNAANSLKATNMPTNIVNSIKNQINVTRTNNATINAMESKALAKVEDYIDEILQKLEG